MDVTEFVKAFKDEKAWQMRDYFADAPETETGALIQSLKLTEKHKEILQRAFDSCLTDTFYTVLLALDGSTSIGSMQHTFKLYDEDNKLLSDCGDLEAEAWEQFHGESESE